MRHTKRLLLITVLWMLALPSQAENTVKVGRWNTEKAHYVYSIAELHTKTGKHGTTLTIADNTWGVLLPHGANRLVLDRVDCFGDAPEIGGAAHNCVGWVSTRGQLRIRATVRYGWFDGFEADDSNKPNLELFVHRNSEATLPRINGWKPGLIHEFTVKNADYVLARLFDAQHLAQVKNKKKLFIEIDSDLLLRKVDFGNECGIRYQAEVVSAKPWTDATVVVNSRGWEPHC